MKFPNNILVIGDCFRDVWVEAKADRRSAEADIPIYDLNKTYQNKGGAANVHEALRKITGFDVGFYDSHVWPTKTRILVDGKQVCRFDMNDKLTEIPTTPYLFEDRVVVISDYNKGSIGENVLKNASKAAKEIWINTKLVAPYHQCLDMAGKSAEGPAVNWTCNQREMDANRDFYDRQARVFVTKSENGISFYHYGKEKAWSPSQAKEVVSVSGAGDVTLAALVYCNYAGAGKYDDMLKFAMSAAKVSVEKSRVYCPTLEEIDKAYAIAGDLSKIYDCK